MDRADTDDGGNPLGEGHRSRERVLPQQNRQGDTDRHQGEDGDAVQLDREGTTLGEVSPVQHAS